MSKVDRETTDMDPLTEADVAEIINKAKECASQSGWYNTGFGVKLACDRLDRLFAAHQALQRERAAIASELGVDPSFDLATHLRGVLATRDAWVDQSAELSALRSDLQRAREAHAQLQDVTRRLFAEPAFQAFARLLERLYG